MIFNQEIKDKIEDALIHFEDAGYPYLINYEFVLGHRVTSCSTVGNKTYDLLKKIQHNDRVEFGDRLIVRIYRHKKIMNWSDYQFYHSELKTAIKRMTDDFDKVQISEGEYTDILIPGSTWEFQNIRQLTEKCRNFNAHNKFPAPKTNNIIVYPEYHTEEGIVVYVREIIAATPGSIRYERFSLLNQVIKPEYYDDKKEEMIDGHKVTSITTREKLSVSLERVFGKDCVVKMYEEGEAEKENPYLSQSQLSKYIVAKIKCDFIKV